MLGSHPISLFTAHACAAKASFASTRSRSATVQPAFSSAFLLAYIGPTPIIFGSSPAVAYEAILARGSMPLLPASSADMTSAAAAPSFMPEAFAAVTLPSFENAGLSFCMFSIVAPCLMYSSFSTKISPFRVLTVNGTISSVNLPAVCAASALFWDNSANASCVSRDICHCSATFSAVCPM